MNRDTDALTVLREARSAILQGNYSALAQLNSRTEQLIAQASRDPKLAAKVHRFARRNQQLLEQSLRGVKMVQEAVELRRSGAKAFTYYGADGSQTTHAVLEHNSARRI